MVRMFDITNDQQYLDIAIDDEAYMYNYWTDSDCNGGMIQNIRTNMYKNAIANELYMLLTAELHNRIPDDKTYLKKAKTTWDWFQATGMINSDSLVNDGLAENDDHVCFNNQGVTWTYNQGVILGAAAGTCSPLPLSFQSALTPDIELWRATKNTTYLTPARKIADAVIASDLLNGNGTLAEPCETADPANCDNDQQVFKGIFARYLSELSHVLDGDPYRSYLQHNAKSAVDKARSKDNLYDLSWVGPYKSTTLGTQASAVSLLISVI